VVQHQDIVEGHISDVEAFVNRAFHSNQIDGATYADAVTALSESALALARIGRSTAERPMRAASEAESRLFGRAHANPVVRQSVRAAVAAMLCLVDLNDPRSSQHWLGELVRLMPRRREPDVPRAVARPVLAGAARDTRLSVRTSAWHSGAATVSLAARRQSKLASAAV
jgi:hypothetical protein